MRNRIQRTLLCLLLLAVGSAATLAQDDGGGYNPVSPGEPGDPTGLVKYRVAVAANIPEAGIVKGAGTYKAGTRVTISTTPVLGYTFLHWSCNGDAEAYSTNTSFTYTVGKEDVTFTAVYDDTDGYQPVNPIEPGEPDRQMTYKVSVRQDDPQAGTVTGGGTYQCGSRITLRATTNPGYTFLHWSRNGATEPYNTNPAFTYTVEAADVVFTAIHKKVKTVSVTTNNPAAGTVSGGGSYDEGQIVTLQATVNPYFTFLHWIKDGSDTPYSTDPVCTYIMTDEDANFQAVYQGPPTVTAVSNDDYAGIVDWHYSYNILSSDRQQHDLEIGTGTVGTNLVPFGTGVRFSTTQTIYPADQLGGAGLIRSIAYYVQNASAYTSNLQIYMGHRSGSQFSDATDCAMENDLMLVYDHATTLGQSQGWEAHTLDTPFPYNGHDNLVVVVTHNAAAAQTALQYRYTTVSASTLRRQSDTSMAYSSVASSENYTLQSSRPDVQFGIEREEVLEYGTQLVAHLTATPKPGYEFKHWLLNGSHQPHSTEPILQYPLSDQPLHFTAVFRLNPDNPGEPATPESAQNPTLQDNSTTSIYDLSGRTLTPAFGSATAKSLPRGLYIIRGKKVIH